MSIRNQPCAYCGAQAAGRDHVVPRSIAKKYPALPDHLRATVPACLPCNVRKINRKLVPPSWAERIPELCEAIPGAWRVWRGDTSEPAFSGVWR